MNYSETYFELDSEEATHSYPLSPIVTLSVMCTLKGMCQHTLFDLGGVEILKYKRSKQCRRCRRYSTDFKALNAMYVEDGVCGYYATLHTEYCYSSHSCRRCRRCQILLYSVYRAPCPSRGKGYSIYLSLPPCGLAVHHHAVRGGSFVLKCSWICQTTRVIAGKTHSISPILKTKGRSATR